MRSPRFLPSALMTRGQLAALAAFSVLKAAGLILLATGLGRWLAGLAGESQPAGNYLYLAVAGALLRAIAAWGLSLASRRLGSGAKERLRAQLLRTAAKRPVIGADEDDFSVPGTATLASHGIDKLDDYFGKFIPAFTSAAVLPVLLGAYTLYLDWLGALILALTIPLVPLFMALIGLHTQDTIRDSQQSLDALSKQLYELALGLPALIGLGRAREHGNAMARASDRYRQATMANLRTVFMSSFWLELISTLSVAVLAVTIGVRLVGGGMELSAGLIILILAPEVFGSLREVGSAYHAADEGLAAYDRLQNFHPTSKAPVDVQEQSEPKADSALQVQALTLRYPGHEPVYRNYSLRLRFGQRQLLDTPSGTGKTTLLTAIAESRLGPAAFAPQLLSGQITLGTNLAVISQHPQFSEPTGRDQLTLDAPQASETQIAEMCQRLGLASLLDTPIAGYSPGELRRLEVARACLTVHSDPTVRLLLADEPTAHLDSENARVVRELLEELPEDCAVLLASHDPLLGGTQAAVTRSQQRPEAASETEPQHTASEMSAPAQATAASKRPTWRPSRELLRTFPSARKAIGYGALSLLCATALAALSGWLIVQASYQPAILHLTVAFVAVRTLGIGRAVFRYLEQLAVHDAVLRYATALREKIWNAMVSDPARWGLMGRGNKVLRYLLAEVDQLRDLLARVIFPPITAALTMLAACVALWLIQPSFGMAALVLLLVLGGPLALGVRAIEGKQLAEANLHRVRVSEQTMSLLRHRFALRAYNRLDDKLGHLAQAESQNTARIRRQAWGQGIGPALAGLSCALLAVHVIATSQVDAAQTALAVLLALALADPAGGAMSAVQNFAALRTATDRMSAQGLNAPQSQLASESEVPDVHGYELTDLNLSYQTDWVIVQGLNARIEPGQWTSITGPSGAGKSTLMAALLGALKPSDGTLTLLDAQGGAVAAPEGLLPVAWCPQEAHLFDSTVRRNLLLGVRGELPSDDTLRQTLRAVGLERWLAEQPHGLDTRIGSSGHNLSGGQRCKLAVARALLGGGQVILLDEPTAHLGTDESAELMQSLRTALAGRTVVLITHDASLAASCPGRIVLPRLEQHATVVEGQGVLA